MKRVKSRDEFSPGDKPLNMFSLYKNILSDDNTNAFFFYYLIDNEKGITVKRFSRREFLCLVLKAAWLMKESGIGKGDSILHYFCRNDYADSVFRIASTITGAVPVTVNWQADDMDRILFKYENSGAAAVLIGEDCDPGHVKMIKQRFPDVRFIYARSLEEAEILNESEFASGLSDDSTRIIIYTSGTTGEPKGVRLSYGNYLANYHELTELLGVGEDDELVAVIVNPLHHANSTAFIDAFLRKRNTRIHLLSRYSTSYWKIICDISDAEKESRIVAPVTSRHFEFLAHLAETNSVPVEIDVLKKKIRRIDFVYGSAPAGPNAIRTMQEYTGRIPCVRYGSTETTLQLIGIPYSLDQETRMNNFLAGWNHQLNGEKTPGYYIGRAAEPYVEVKIVRSFDPANAGYLEEAGQGETGYFVARGSNVMTGYVNNPEGTARVFDGDWYLNLGDVGFYLMHPAYGAKEFYWMDRSVGLMIKGGANYSCDQAGNELSAFLAREYNLPPCSFLLAVIGLKVSSESEDSCCVTIELLSDESVMKMDQIGESFMQSASKAVSKGAKPDFLRFGKIPRNFKGASLYNELKQDFIRYIEKTPG